MFLEAFTRLGLKFEYFDVRYCYSFVLQHPENQIVSPFGEANIIHTNTYECLNNTVREHVLLDGHERLTVPKVYNASIVSPADIIKTISSGNGIDYLLQGIVICDRSTGLRCKVRNPKYEYVKHLKGNDPTKQFNYYKLRQEDRCIRISTIFPQRYLNICKFQNTTP